MFSRSSWRPTLPRLALTASALVALSACAAGAGSSSAPVATQAAAATSGATSRLLSPAVAADPATARDPGAASATATTKGLPSAGATSAGRTASKEQAATAVSTPGAAAAGAVYGFSDPNLVNESASVQLQQLEQMKAMGVTSIRLDAGWAWVEPTAGSYDWSALDQVISSINQVGFSIDLIIDQCPSWAGVSSADGSVWAQPASAATYATYAAAVAARYGSKGVKYFEIWNEPNINNFWVPTPDPAAYTADLQAAYSAIKQVDPSATVISGGLSPATTTATTIDPRTFLEDMYSDGAEGSFDGLGDHPYSYPLLPDDEESWSGWSQMSQTSPSLRSIMAANGDSSKKIWITEFGAPTTGSNSVGEDGQAAALTQAIAQAQSFSWLGSFYIYTWADLASEPEIDNGFGLLTDSNTEKTAYAAVSAALSSGQ